MSAITTVGATATVIMTAFPTVSNGVHKPFRNSRHGRPFFAVNALNMAVASVLQFLGLLTAFVALPLFFGLVGPNRWFGIRLAAAFVSEENWYAINSYGGLCFLRFGVAAAIGGFLLGRYPALPFWVPLAALWATLGLLLLSLRRIKRFAADLPQTAADNARRDSGCGGRP